MGTRFDKMHGLGNDFVILDARSAPVAMTPGLAKALADRLAESFAEVLHAHVRNRLWDYADEHLSNAELIRERYQGIRPAPGYPACPELADQVKLFELLRPERIDITLTEEYHLEPEQSTTAIICHHPEARYFGIK